MGRPLAPAGVRPHQIEPNGAEPRGSMSPNTALSTLAGRTRISGLRASGVFRLSGTRAISHAMTLVLASALMPLLRRFNPERAQQLAIRGLQLGLVGRDASGDPPVLATEAFGLKFRNPIGLAAGFDKNAEAVGELTRLGFGFVETGTVTPHSQFGNPRPRVFRLPEDLALINRLGFNNCRSRYLRCPASEPRPKRCAGRAQISDINRSTDDPGGDYAMMLGALASAVDYVVINVSSPNTPGLRELQESGATSSDLPELDQLCALRTPILLKVAPDLSREGLAAVVEVCVAHRVDGLVLTNTTVDRPPGFARRVAKEMRGLIRPATIREINRHVGACASARAGRLTLIGVGGVASGEDALMKLKAGGNLVQLYTALVFEGPALIQRIKRELVVGLRRDGFASVGDAVGVDAVRLARSG